MNDLVQGWSNLRIKYFKIRHWKTTSRWRRSQFIHWISQLHFFDPLHRFRRKLWTSTYLGLESYLPASKRHWCRELVKVKVQNLQSLVCSIILFWRVSLLHWRWLNFWLTVQTGISDIDLVLAFHFSPLCMNGAAPLSMNSTVSIIVDEVQMMTHLDLQKRFPMYRVPNTWRPFSAARHSNRTA